MVGFVSVVAGTESPVEFFSSDNIGRIMQAGTQPALVGQAGPVTSPTDPSPRSSLR
jgi:hypothetical protein